MARTWILTGSPENHPAARAHGYAVVGLEQRHRTRADEIEPGERLHERLSAAAGVPA